MKYLVLMFSVLVTACDPVVAKLVNNLPVPIDTRVGASPTDQKQGAIIPAGTTVAYRDRNELPQVIIVPSPGGSTTVYHVDAKTLQYHKVIITTPNGIKYEDLLR